MELKFADFFTSKQAAEILFTSKTTSSDKTASTKIWMVGALIHGGFLRGSKLNGQWLIEKDSVNRLKKIQLDFKKADKKELEVNYE